MKKPQRIIRNNETSSGKFLKRLTRNVRKKVCYAYSALQRRTSISCNRKSNDDSKTDFDILRSRLKYANVRNNSSSNLSDCGLVYKLSKLIHSNRQYRGRSDRNVLRSRTRRISDISDSTVAPNNCTQSNSNTAFLGYYKQHCASNDGNGDEMHTIYSSFKFHGSNPNMSSNVSNVSSVAENGASQKKKNGGCFGWFRRKKKKEIGDGTPGETSNIGDQNSTPYRFSVRNEEDRPAKRGVSISVPKRSVITKKAGATSAFEVMAVDETTGYVRKKKRGGRSSIRPSIRFQEEIDKLGPPYALTEDVSVVCLIHTGNFGYVFRADMRGVDDHIAVKCNGLKEGFHEMCGEGCTDLSHEEVIIRSLSEFPGFCQYYCKFHSKKTNVIPYTFLGMELLGPNLRQLLEYCSKKFSNRTTLMLGIQMIKRVQQLHSINIIHRDIKPENFAMGRGRNFNTLYLIDFSSAKPLDEEVDDRLVTEKSKEYMVGSTRFSSLRGHETNRRNKVDDIESMAYTLIYLNRGYLPWVPKCNKTGGLYNIEKVYKKKLNMNIKRFCRRCPKPFSELLMGVRDAHAESEPRYDEIKSSFMEAMKKKSYKNDAYYDWTRKFCLKYNRQVKKLKNMDAL